MANTILTSRSFVITIDLLYHRVILQLNFYILPFAMYFHIGLLNQLMVLTLKNLLKFGGFCDKMFIKIGTRIFGTPAFGRLAMRNKMYFSMEYIYSKDSYLKSLSIQKSINSNKLNKFIPDSYNHFININGIIYFVFDKNMLINNLQKCLPITPIIYSMPKTDLIMVSEATMGKIFSYFSQSKVSKKERNEFISAFKRLKPMLKILDYPQFNCIIDSRGKYASFINGKFVLHNLRDSDVFRHTTNTPPKDLADGYIYSNLNGGFIYGQYHISERAKELLRKITGNNPVSLKTIAKLTVAAYSNDLPLKDAVVIVAKDDAYKCVENFFEKLFDENIYVFGDESLKNQKTFFDAYTDTLFMSGGAYVIKEGQTINFKLLRKIIKSAYLEIYDKCMGKIRFRNKIPVIALTQSEEYAQAFRNHAKSHIINCDDDFCLPDNIPADELIHLRQALALYGLKLFSSSKQSSDLPESNAKSDDGAVKEFVRLYCKNSENGVVGKGDIKDAFKKYISAYYPTFTGSPLAVCNYLQDLGYDTTHKKRINGSQNPIGVIMKIEFNSDKFEKDISIANKAMNYEEPEIKKDEFNAAWAELLSSII